MARRCFFSFHYKQDVWRAQQVKNAWVTRNREDAGFFDGSAFESKKRTGDDAVKRFLDAELKGSSVTCVLIGAQTASRRWVKYEIVRSFQQGKGLVGARIHGLKNMGGGTDSYGDDPFDVLAYSIDEKKGRVAFLERINGKWAAFADLPSMSLVELAYNIGSKTNHTFSTLFSVYDYSTQQGYTNIGTWIEDAALAAGR